MSSSREFRPSPARRDRGAGQQQGSAPAPVVGGPESRVLRGDEAAAVATARIDSDLRGGRGRASLDPEAREQALQSARAQGYADGWSEGQRAATAAVRAEAEREQARFAQLQQEYAEAVQRALVALNSAADDLESRVAQPMMAAESELATAALTLAEAVLGRELALAEDPGIDAVRRALAMAPANRPIVLRLSPPEAVVVQAALDAGTIEAAIGREITVVPDPTVDAAGCVAECDATRIDAQLGPALARVWEVLAS